MQQIPSYITDNVAKAGEAVKKGEFEVKRSILNNSIKVDIESAKDTLKKNVLLEISKLPDSTEDSYKVKHFLYNNGNFRTMDEIDQFNAEIRYMEEYRREQRRRENAKQYFSEGYYEEDCGSPFWCWLPFIIDIFLFICSIPSWGDLLVVTMLLLPVTLAISALLRAGYSSRCIKIANEHKYYANTSPKYNKEVGNLKCMGAAAAITAISTYHSINKSVKDLSNPSGWNVLK